MKRDEILDAIATLARAQGFYGRLHEKLVAMRDDEPDKYDQLMTTMEAHDFKDVVDLCIYLETWRVAGPG